eukprot:1157905-Pelagomonas_calceolata.AAC.2
MESWLATIKGRYHMLRVRCHPKQVGKKTHIHTNAQIHIYKHLYIHTRTHISECIKRAHPCKDSPASHGEEHLGLVHEILVGERHLLAACSTAHPSTHNLNIPMPLHHCWLRCLAEDETVKAACSTAYTIKAGYKNPMTAVSSLV